MSVLGGVRDPMGSGTGAGQRSRDQRRDALMRSSHLTGLDYVQVRERVSAGRGDGEGAEEGGHRWFLDLHFVPALPGSGKRPVPPRLEPGDVEFHMGGKADRRVRVERLEPRNEPNVVTALVRTPVDFAPDPREPLVYRLELRREDVLAVDPLFSSSLVRFDPGTSTTWSLPSLMAGEEATGGMPGDHLAKDYDSFRRLLMERMSYFIPSWAERNPSDLGVTVLEVLAYAADYLSYQQDAVATEAYLETARRRVSVRRHSRLLDFHLQEGTNARAWVQIRVSPGYGPDGAGDEGGPEAVLPAGTVVLTSASRTPGVVAPGTEDYERAVDGGSLFFESLHPGHLHPGHQELEIHTWGADDFNLAAGATSTHLVGHWPGLAEGDVLIFEQYQGHTQAASAGSRRDVVVADPRERHPVRLAEPPRLRHDPLSGTDVTEVTWYVDDALPGPFPVARSEGAVRHRGLTRVRGNVVLCDHGLRIRELLPPVPGEGPYAPRLSESGLTFRVPYVPAVVESEPARWALEQGAYDPRGDEEATRPDVQLYELPRHWGMGDREGAEAALSRALAEGPSSELLRSLPRWRPRLDLLASSRFSRHFVVEVDEEGWSHLRFGDGENGRQPSAGSWFVALYRVGVGPEGNVGSHSLRHVVMPPALHERLALAGAEVTGAVNHLPAMGGHAATPMDYARIYAPDRIHTEDFQARFATEMDSARLAQSHPEIRDAAARHVWTGSSHTVELYLLPTGSRDLSPDLRRRLNAFLRPRLLVGWDLQMRPPLWVPLDIEVTVWLERGERAERIYERLAAGAGGGILPPGTFAFGKPVYASQVTSRFLEVPGVADVRLEVFQRWGQPPAGELEDGVIPIGPLEIARLDNDPEAPQRGTLRLDFVHAGQRVTP